MYIVRSGGFIGCPADAHDYASLLCNAFADVPRPGGLCTINYWKKAGSVAELNASVPTQHTIVRTRDAETSPVFILLKNTIGSPVVEPAEGWSTLRSWLGRKGFGYISLLGPKPFTDRASIPKDTVPLTGTLFELFDALSSETVKEVRILHINETPSLKGEEDRLQLAWTKRILNDLKSAYTVIDVDSFDQFRSQSVELIKDAFGLPSLDPFTDPLPGLATSHTHLPLFGRERLVTQLGQRVTSDHHRFSVIVGVSGVGKSSLLYAGLLPYLFPSYAQASRKRFSTLIFSPLSLCSRNVLTHHPSHAEEIIGLASLDPLQNLATFLRENTTSPATRYSPDLTIESITDPPPPSGEPRVDLIAAIHWWMEVFKSVETRIIIMIDQAEQVELIARRAMALQAEQSADTPNEPLALNPGWWRFTALLSLLGDSAQFSFEQGGDFGKFNSFLSDHPVSVVLTVHRRKSLRLWPLDPRCLDDPFVVNPISDAPTIERIISGTFMRYGLELESPLLTKMTNEAAALADQFIAIRTPDPDPVHVLDSTKKASVLPLIAVAMGNMLTYWRQHANALEHPPIPLTLNTYAQISAVSTSIQSLGEDAWSEARQTMSQLLELSPDSHFDAQTLQVMQEKAFEDFMAMLVDANEREGIELAFVPRWLTLDTAQDALRLAFSNHRLLVGVGERYWRLPHRTLLEHWQRADHWAEASKRRLSAKSDLLAFYRVATKGATVSWSRQQHEQFADLGLFWIGSNTGHDADLRRWLNDELIVRLDTEDLNPDCDSRIERLPFDAMLEQRWELATPLIGRCVDKGISKEHMGLILSIACQYHYQPILNRMLPTDAAIIPYIDVVEPHTGYFPLLLAVNYEHTDLCKQLLKAGANPNLHSPRSRTTALIQACDCGNRTIVETLLHYGASLELSETDIDSTPLVAAVCSANEELVSFLLQSRIDVHQRHRRTGDLSLHIACTRGYSNLVSLLLAHSCDPNDINPVSAGTPLMLAAFSGATAAVKLLIDARADVSHVHSDTGETALALASGLGHLDIVALLLAHHADPAAVNPKSGNTPLLLACESGHKEIVRLLLDEGACPDPVEAEGGVFPLLLAARNGHDQCVHHLLQAGADPRRESILNGNFAMLLAADYGHTSIVLTLLQAGERIDRRNTHNQSTALLLATEAGQTDVVKLLIEQGVDTNKVNGATGESALQFAAMNNHVDAMTLLLDHGADPTWPRPAPGTDALFFASQSGYHDAVELLLTHSTCAQLNVNNRDEGGEFALLIAAQENHLDVVRLLLSHEADPNLINPISGAFPLLIAAQLGHHQVVELLLQSDANPDQIDPRDGGFALVNSAQEGHIRVVEILLDHNASINQYDTIEGSTALCTAIDRGHIAVVERLVADSDLDFVNPVTGETPLGVAIRAAHRSDKIAKLLIDHGANPDQSVNRAGDTPLIAALEHERAAIVQWLLLKGVDPDSLPSQLTTRLEQISVAKDIEPTIDPVAANALETGTTGNEDFFERYHHVARGFHGQWKVIDELEKSRKLINDTVTSILELPYEIAESARHEKLDPQLTPGVSIFRTTYTDSRQQNENPRIERLWLRPSDMTLAAEINTALSLNGIIRDYGKHWKTLDMRSAQEHFLFASLVLLTSQPTRIPVTPETPIRSRSGQTISRFNFDDDGWRTWKAMPYSGDEIVILPWVFEHTLYLGKIKVTHDGIGSRILEESDVVCDEEISLSWLE